MGILHGENVHNNDTFALEYDYTAALKFLNATRENAVRMGLPVSDIVGGFKVTKSDGFIMQLYFVENPT